MSGYLLTVMGTVLLCTLLTAIAPEGKTSATIKGIARLACVLTIVAPVLQFFKSGSLQSLFGEEGKNFFSQTVITEDESYIQYYSETRVSQTQTALEKELYEKYAIETEIIFEWKMETETFAKLYETELLKIERIRIGLSKDVTEEVKNAVGLYVTENYCSEVLIE